MSYGYGTSGRLRGAALVMAAYQQDEAEDAVLGSRQGAMHDPLSWRAGSNAWPRLRR